jgi:hypothetical protein
VRRRKVAVVETDARRYLKAGPVVCGVHLRGAEATDNVSAYWPGVKYIGLYQMSVIPSASTVRGCICNA